MAKINPVKATCMKYKGHCDLADINDTCYGICAAFSGTTDVYNMDPNCTQACDEFIEQKKIDQYGVGNCDHQAPYKPVIWGQVPRYIPQLIKEMSPKQALKTCNNMCMSMPNLVNECQDHCELDYNAIEQQEVTEGFQKLPDMRVIQFVENPTKNFEKEHPVAYGFLMALLIVVIIVVAILVFRAISKK